MINFISKLLTERHYLVLNDIDVLEALGVIDDQHVWYINQNLMVGRRDKSDFNSKWFISFDVTKKQWAFIVADLHSRGFSLVIKSEDPDNVHLIKKNRA